MQDKINQYLGKIKVAGVDFLRYLDRKADELDLFMMSIEDSVMEFFSLVVMLLAIIGFRCLMMHFK